MSEGDHGMCPLEKKNIFEANSRDLVRSFCLSRPHNLRRPISTKNREGTHPTHEWRPYRHVNLFPFCPLLSLLLFLFLSLFSFLSFFPFFFGAPLVAPGGRGPQSPPPRIRPCYHREAHSFQKVTLFIGHIIILHTSGTHLWHTASTTINFKH